jgi:protein arginine kinase activator
MAKPLNCNFCSKPATVHLTKIVANKVHNVDLCEECAQQKGVTNPGFSSLGDLLAETNLKPEAPALPGVRCEQCGFSQSDFKKHGRFGCPSCYDAFAVMLEPMLDGMHKGTRHTGKVPQAALERKSLYDRLAKLELDLSDAIKSERYEEAARYRDEISLVKLACAPKPTA